jgi:hypothetical protein
VTDGVENADPLEDPSAVVQGRDPRIMQPPLVMRPPVVDETNPDQSADDGQNEGAPPGVAPTPTNPFGVPAGSSTMPGVISPAPRPQQPQQRPTTNRVQ